MPGADQQLSGDRDLRRVGAVAGGEPAVVLVKGIGRPPGLVGGLDRGPAKRPRAGLRKPPGRRAIARLDDPRSEAGIADQLRGRRKARDLADLRGEGEADQRPDAGDRLQQLCPRIGVGDRRKLCGRSGGSAAGARRSGSRCSAIESRQTAGTPRRSSSSIASGWRRRVKEIRRPNWVSRPKIRFRCEVRSLTR